ncbi:MAG TPA: DUF2203 domain-containing protein [Candidatus Limnocylindrales bacterium]|jgi:hypothetical protein|nr:DUF2203 domain-containing protein [Candidatus Limnocylindrales bacterium]
MPKRFTLAEAQGLIPLVTRYVREAIQIKGEYEEAEAAIRNMTERVMLMGGVVVDRKRALEARTRRETAAARLRNSIEQIQGLGCVVKDLDIGLVDFPTLFRGKEVYLCWKLGERGIEYWHGVDEGFRGRKYIDRDFLDHHAGD